MTVPELRHALKEHRLSRGLSYEALTEAIGPDRVSTPTVRRFIESETEPHQTTVYAVREYLSRQVAA